MEIRRCGKSYLLNNLFYHYLLDSDVDANQSYVLPLTQQTICI